MSGETKEEKFIRLASARVPKALEAIRLVGQLSSANYQYSEQAAEEVVEALREAVSEVGAKFHVPNPQTVEELSRLLNGSVEDLEEQPVVPSFPAPVVLSADELEYDGPVNAEDIRNVFTLLTYHQDIQGALTVLRNALIEEPRNS